MLISSLTQKLNDIIKDLSQKQIEYLLLDWSIWADELQWSPKGDWVTWLILGGRGAGKTRAGAEWIRWQIEGATPLTRGKRGLVALVGQTYSDVREIMINGSSGLLNICHRDFKPIFISSRRLLEWPNGAKAYCFSSEDPDGIRGLQFDCAWSDELCKWSYPQECWDNLQLALRIGKQPQQIATTTPKNLSIIKTIKANKNTITTVIPTHNNQRNLSPIFLSSVLQSYQGTSFERQEIYGEILANDQRGLFKQSVIDKSRISDCPKLDVIIIAVDPPVTSNPHSDACGIIVVGSKVLEDNLLHFYIIDDCSVKSKTPLQWAKKVVDSYEIHHADNIIIEVNQGGELVTTIIGQIRNNLPITSVRAKINKQARATPIAALYEQGRIHHTKELYELEQELLDFGTNNKSPDRVDALVWGVTYFLNNNANPIIKSF